MEQENALGTNCTGNTMFQQGSEQLEEEVEKLTPAITSSLIDLEKCRVHINAKAETEGAVPPSVTLKSAINVGLPKNAGAPPEILIDKLGERLAFERAGVSLYQALILKYQVSIEEGEFPSSLTANTLNSAPTLGEVLYRIQNEELEHFHLIADMMRKIGADSPVQTPSAHVIGVAAQGIMQVLTDPRTNMPQCLNAILSAELINNAGWEILIELATQAGDEEMAERFRLAFNQEQEHLLIIKTWLHKLLEIEKLEQIS